MKKNIKIKNTLFISLVISATIAILTITLFWGYNEIKNSEEEIQQIRANSLQMQKDKLKREVNTILDYIRYTIAHHQDIPLNELQDEILDYISSVRFGSGGYIFVNKIDGQALVFDGEKLTRYKNNMGLTDVNGKNILAPQIKAFHKKEEGGFMQYYFKRIEGTEAEAKISYIKGYHDWDWIIGAGDYLRDIDNAILASEDNLKQKLKTQITFILVLLAILIVGIAYFSYFLSTYINREFDVFKKYFNRASTGDLIDISTLTIVELQTIAETANKMANKINNTTALLMESEEKFRTITENSADAIFILDAQGNYQYVNKKATELLGYTSEEYTKMNISDLSPEEDKKNDIKDFQDLIKNGKMFSEIRLIAKNKKIIPVDLNAVILPNGNVFGSCRDISKRKNTEAELYRHRTKLEELVNNRTLELEEKNAELERFNKLFIGREFRIKELKDQLKKLTK